MALNAFPGQKIQVHVEADYVGIEQDVSFECIIDVPSVANADNPSAWDHNGSSFTKTRWGFAWSQHMPLSTSPYPVVTDSPIQTIPSSVAGLGALNLGLHVWLAADATLSAVKVAPGVLNVYVAGISNVSIGTR